MMSYSFDADFVDPYFLDVGEKLIDDLQKIKDDDDDNDNKLSQKSSNNVLLSYVSNCNFADQYRLKNLNELKNILKDSMTFAGKCGPDSETNDTNNINNYHFYASFENSQCPYYLTEKLWVNAILKNRVPIIGGSTRSEIEKMLPKSAFLHLDDFANNYELSETITSLSKPENLESYQKFFEWKKDFHLFGTNGDSDSSKIDEIGMCKIMKMATEGTLSATRKGNVYSRLNDELRNCRTQISPYFGAWVRQVFNIYWNTGFL